jgi:hypothetical protein
VLRAQTISLSVELITLSVCSMVIDVRCSTP